MPLDTQNEPEQLLMPMEWMDIRNLGKYILNQDGWRKGDYPRSMAEPISESEFNSRLKGFSVPYA